jgi:hypothetical protein
VEPAFLGFDNSILSRETCVAWELTKNKKLNQTNERRERRCQ